MTTQDKPTTTLLPTDSANCKDTKIEQPKPTQNSEDCAAQLGPNQQIFVKQWVKKKKEGAQPKDKNREGFTTNQSLSIYKVYHKLTRGGNSYTE